jgi:hypothetical protein
MHFLNFSPLFATRAALACVLLLVIPGAAAQNRSLVSADYGVRDNRIDVTSRVQSLLRNGNLNFRADNQTLAVNDPAPGQVKELRIKLRDSDGRVQDYRFREGDSVNLSLNGQPYGGYGGNYNGPPQDYNRDQDYGRSSDYNSWRGKLRGDDQRRFDDYYTKWLKARQDRRRDEVTSMEMRMLDVYKHNGVPANTPYEMVASSNIAQPTSGYESWRGRLPAEDQQRMDSYYQRWIEARQKDDRSQISSMEGRMLDILEHNRIPANTPYEFLVSRNVVPNYNWRGNDSWGHGSPGYRDELQILQATYGVPGRQTDVTRTLQGMVNQGTLRLRVSNETFGTDPAPGQPKRLYLVYDYRGQQRSLTLNENSELRIPETLR